MIIKIIIKRKSNPYSAHEAVFTGPDNLYFEKGYKGAIPFGVRASRKRWEEYPVTIAMPTSVFPRNPDISHKEAGIMREWKIPLWPRMKDAVFEKGTHVPILLLKLSMSGKTPKKAHTEIKTKEGILGKETESNVPAIRENKRWVKKSMVLSDYKLPLSS